LNNRTSLILLLKQQENTKKLRAKKEMLVCLANKGILIFQSSQPILEHSCHQGRWKIQQASNLANLIGVLMVKNKINSLNQVALRIEFKTSH
tara:strand:- start:583 stop:858 length:276 start_codon:yes stop_codon:yes gene_type:complete